VTYGPERILLIEREEVELDFDVCVSKTISPELMNWIKEIDNGNYWPRYPEERQQNRSVH
jgi:hypothetical protein